MRAIGISHCSSTVQRFPGPSGRTSLGQSLHAGTRRATLKQARTTICSTCAGASRIQADSTATNLQLHGSMPLKGARGGGFVHPWAAWPRPLKPDGIRRIFSQVLQSRVSALPGHNLHSQHPPPPPSPGIRRTTRCQIRPQDAHLQDGRTARLVPVAPLQRSSRSALVTPPPLKPRPQWRKGRAAAGVDSVQILTPLPEDGRFELSRMGPRRGSRTRSPLAGLPP